MSASVEESIDRVPPPEHLTVSAVSGTKRERKEWVYATTAGLTDSLAIEIASDGSGLRFVTPMQGAESRTEYERENRDPKILNRVPLDADGTLPFKSNKALTATRPRPLTPTRGPYSVVPYP